MPDASGQEKHLRITNKESNNEQHHFTNSGFFHTNGARPVASDSTPGSAVSAHIIIAYKGHSQKFLALVRKIETRPVDEPVEPAGDREGTEKIRQ
jgi:hypothetical protein